MIYIDSKIKRMLKAITPKTMFNPIIALTLILFLFSVFSSSFNIGFDVIVSK